MNKLQLPTVTCIIVDCLRPDRAINVLNHCKSMVDFGAVKLLTDSPIYYEHKVEIMPIKSLIAYSIFMLTRIHEYIDTEHVLIVQGDGWILNPDSFDVGWLELDYIGPLFMQYDKVGSGGFSLRSKRLMKNTAYNTPQWDGTDKNAHQIQEILYGYEDGVICLSGLYNGFKVATLEQAANFAQGGNRSPQYFRERPFGFHRTWQVIDFQTGVVDSSDISRDIHKNYDYEINKLTEE